MKLLDEQIGEVLKTYTECGFSLPVVPMHALQRLARYIGACRRCASVDHILCTNHHNRFRTPADLHLQRKVDRLTKADSLIDPLDCCEALKLGANRVLPRDQE